MPDSFLGWLVVVETWLVLVWAFRHLAITVVFWRTPRLMSNSPRFDAAQNGVAPRVSILLPCKDEQENLAYCATDLLAQNYPNFDVVIIDDRSADGTAKVAQSITEADSRVKFLRLDDRPPGWTGKTYALTRGMEYATGDWLLFVDADTRHHPDCLSICMEWAARRQAAMISLLPKMRCETFWERVNQPLCGIVLMRSYPPELVNSDWSGMAFANGQFILVERSVYEAAGGHAAVRDKFVEDIYLAREVKRRLKRRVLTAVAPEICSTRMYSSLSSQVQGWARIYYDAWRRNAFTAVWKIAEPMVFTQTAYVMPFVALGYLAFDSDSSLALRLLWLSLLHNLLMFAVIARMYRFNHARWRDAIWYPLSGLVSDWIYVRVIRMCLTGRVTWRGTTYETTRGPDGGSLAEPHLRSAGAGQEASV